MVFDWRKIWEKLTHRQSIWPWIILPVGVLLLFSVHTGAFSFDASKNITVNEDSNTQEGIRQRNYSSENFKVVEADPSGIGSGEMLFGMGFTDEPPLSYPIDGFMCPESYPDAAAAKKGIEDFLISALEKYPDATFEEVMEYRLYLLKAYNCEKTLANIAANNQSSDDEAPVDGELTEQEVYQDPYIKHLRLALDEYLSGSRRGIEDEAVEAATWQSEEECGLARFDKAYYRSKFFIYSTEAGKYGGRIADIVFVDKPDTLFEALIYRYDTGEYVLRYFCKAGPAAESQDDFTELMRAFIKDIKFSL